MKALQEALEVLAAIDWWFNEGDAGLRRESQVMAGGDERGAHEAIRQARENLQRVVDALEGIG